MRPSVVVPLSLSLSLSLPKTKTQIKHKQHEQNGKDKTTCSTMSSDQIEPLYVLYGSQMGNAEQAAKDFCSKVGTVYTPEYFSKHNLPPVTVQTTCIQLDDFLELHHAKFTKCIVIFVSSYGVGQAPLGAYRFRELCEYWKEKYGAATATTTTSSRPLDGLKYALCGLGDSSYPTYLKNPTTIDQGLIAAGASRIGEMGTANANALGDNSQDKVITRWVESTWLPLAKALSVGHGVSGGKDNDDDDDENKKKDYVNVAAMQKATIPILCELDPDYTPPKGFNDGLMQGNNDNNIFFGLPTSLLVGIVAIGIGLATAISSFIQSSNNSSSSSTDTEES